MGLSWQKDRWSPYWAEFIFSVKETDNKQASIHMNEMASHSGPFHEDSKGGCCVGGVGEV